MKPVLAAALAALFLLQLAAAQTCSLYGEPFVSPFQLFNHETFDEFTPVNRTWTTLVNGALRLAEDQPNGGLVGYAWHFRKERIADGFISTVKFRVGAKANAGDGFTYFIQNDKTVDLNGGTGDKLGAFGIKSSIGIRVDLCLDRPAPCSQQQVGLQLYDSSLNPVAIPSSTASVSNLNDGQIHTLVVTYGGRLFGANSKLRVRLDSTDLFDVTVGDLTTPSFFDGRFAYFGFTASTSWTETADIDITSWKTELMPSDSIVDGFVVNKTINIDFGTVATFKVIRQNSCRQPTGVDDNSTVVATLSQQPTEGVDPLDLIKMNGNVTNNGDGTYTVTFNMPEFVIAKWDLDVVVAGVQAEGMPWIGSLASAKPIPAGSGLPIWALVLLLLLILLIILVLSYVVYRLYRYRKKLQQNAEFIEAGKKQAELDRLEDGTSYVANPMVGTIDDLKTQLAKNEEELERLRRRGALGEDQNFTIEQLQKQRDALLEEMNRLKREDQEEELKRNKGTSEFTAGGRAKKEFGREQI